MKRTRYIRPGMVKVADKHSDAVAYLWTNKGAGKPGCSIYFGQQSKPVLNYYYRDEARRNQAIAEAFKNRQDWLKRKATNRAERVAWVPTYKVGDIFKTSWGYDQTNIEYFEIVEIKGKYAILRELAQERSETGWLQGNCVPLPGQYLKPRFEGDDAGLPIRRLMQKGGIKIDDVRSAWLVEGQSAGGCRVISPSSWTAYH